MLQKIVLLFYTLTNNLNNTLNVPQIIPMVEWNRLKMGNNYLFDNGHNRDKCIILNNRLNIDNICFENSKCTCYIHQLTNRL